MPLRRRDMNRHGQLGKPVTKKPSPQSAALVLRRCPTSSDSSSTARKALSLIINDLRRQQLVLALHFRSPWFWGHTFSLNVGGTATPTAINALWAWPST